MVLMPGNMQRGDSFRYGRHRHGTIHPFVRAGLNRQLGHGGARQPERHEASLGLQIGCSLRC